MAKIHFAVIKAKCVGDNGGSSERQASFQVGCPYFLYQRAVVIKIESTFNVIW